MNTKNVDVLIKDYIQNNITDDIKDEFMNAAIHFMINEDECSDYDLMRIKYRLKKIHSKDVFDCLKLTSVYGYVIYRTIIYKLISEEEKTECCQALINMSNEFTRYLTMEDNESDLYNTVDKALESLNIDKASNELIINKFKDTVITI